MKKLLSIVSVAIFLLSVKPLSLKADTLQWQLPYGIGSVQLPWQSTEVLYGAVVPFGGGLTQEIAGASLPLVYLGKLANGNSMVDGQVGAVGTWPSDGPTVSPYLALGHNFAKDIPALEDFESLHLNGCMTYLTNKGGWYGGGTISYVFGYSGN